MIANYNKDKNKSIFQSFFLILLLCSMGFSLIITFTILQSTSLINKSIFVLPIASIILTLMFISNWQKLRELPVLFCVIFIYIRLNILPYFLAITNYSTEMGLAPLPYINEAVILTIYEALALNIVLFLYYRKKTKKKVVYALTNNHIFSTIVLFLLFFIIGTFIFIPESKSLFRTIFQVTNEDFTTVLFSPSQFDVGELKRAFLTLFTVFFNIFRIILPAIIIFKTSKMTTKNYFKDIVTYLLIFIQFLFITSTIAYTIYVSLVLFLFHSKVNKKSSKYLMYVYSIAGLVVLGYFFARFTVSTVSVNVYTSNMLNAYFTGITNVAGSYNMALSEKVPVLLSTIKSVIPFNNTIFGDVGISINSFFNNSNGIRWQISSTIGNGRYFFGAFLSPIYSIILLNISLFSYSKSKKTNNPMIFISLIFLSIISVISIFMYNEQIFFSWFFSDILPLILISSFFSYKFKQTEMESIK